MTEVAEGVDTSIALVKMIKHRCKGYRLDLKVRFHSSGFDLHTHPFVDHYPPPPTHTLIFCYQVSHTVWRGRHY
jgi:hypothetical protein